MSAVVCDLGGTNCRFGWLDENCRTLKNCRAYRNDNFEDFNTLLSEYLLESNVRSAQDVVIALAAPVNGNRVDLTNRPWTIDKEQISAICSAGRVHFINDYQALAFSLARVDSLCTTAVIEARQSVVDAPRLVVGAGTGYNSALYLHTGAVICAETGHSTLVTETAFDVQLQSYFTKRYGRCSQERVLSGSGMIEIYRLLCSNSGVAARFLNSYEIVQAGVNASDSLATQACIEFVRIMARSVGDLALQSLPFSGIYLAGGVTRGLTDLICGESGVFTQYFIEKGRMKEEMRNFPVHLLDDDKVALYGCAEYLETLLPSSP